MQCCFALGSHTNDAPNLSPRKLTLIAYRLVNEAHDPVRVGENLTRASDHSHQKLGAGMYFAVDEQAAIQFSLTRHGHTYTHLLECELLGLSASDFLDIDIMENARAVRRSTHGGKPYDQRHYDYCIENNLKGVLWRARAGWVELVVFAPFVSNNIVIKKTTDLRPSV